MTFYFNVFRFYFFSLLYKMFVPKGTKKGKKFYESLSSILNSKLPFSSENVLPISA